MKQRIASYVEQFFVRKAEIIEKDLKPHHRICNMNHNSAFSLKAKSRV